MENKKAPKSLTKVTKSNVVDYSKNFPPMVPTPTNIPSTFGKDLNKAIQIAGSIENFNAKLPKPEGVRQFKKPDGTYISETDKTGKKSDIL